MSPSVHEDLNPEPSKPEERQQHHLAPKSYADAVEENLLDDFRKQNNTPTQFVGNGEDDAPRSPMRKVAHKKSGSIRMNDIRKPSQPSNIIEEKLQDRDGEHLTSVRPNPSYEAQLRQDKVQRKVPKRDSHELASGRRAGEGWHRSAIRWAPLNVPLQRRLQTLIVLFHTVCVALFLGLFFFLCAIPVLWPLILPYLLYVLFSTAPHSGTLSRRSNLLRSSRIWSLFASYFPARLHRSTPLPPTRKYIFGYHPHGIISHGAFAALCTEALGFSQLFPGITNTLLTLDTNFRIPLYRDYALAMGLASVSKTSCENLLSKGGPNGEGMGRAITIVIGGAGESLDAQPHSLRLILKRRKGFVKIAIRQGADLVPVLAFGENELYDQTAPDQRLWSGYVMHNVQMLAKKLLGFTLPLFHARGVFNYDVGLMPYRRPVNVVVGRPIEVVRQKEVDEGYLDEVHRLYIKELERIWEEWKDTFAKKRKGELEIVE